jgi:glutaredoxin 3
MPPKIRIFTTPVCPYCRRAKALLDRKGAPYEEIDVYNDPALRENMVREAGGARTVPQIFIGTTHVGGCDDLHALEAAGKLDALLAG